MMWPTMIESALWQSSDLSRWILVGFEREQDLTCDLAMSDDVWRCLMMSNDVWWCLLQCTYQRTSVIYTFRDKSFMQSFSAVRPWNEEEEVPSSQSIESSSNSVGESLLQMNSVKTTGYTHTYLCICMYAHIYAYIHKYIHMYTYINTYIHASIKVAADEWCQAGR